MRQFPNRYRSWAVIAGASEGLGVAFARRLAARGMNLLLIARRADLLEKVSGEIRQQYPVEIRCLVQDLGDAQLAGVLREATEGLEVGMLVYNAAHVPTGSFLDTDPESLQQLVRVNVQGPVTAVRTLAPGMCRRKKGAIVLMSSLAGMQGVPGIAAYAATRAFGTILAERLWYELREYNVEVTVSCAGAMPTPGYLRNFRQDAPGMMDPSAVAEMTLGALGRGPRFIPGWVNRIGALITTRLISRKSAIQLMGKSTGHLQ